MARAYQKFTNSRGYVAVVFAHVEGRVLYDTRDEEGRVIQTNGCVSERFFFQNWKAA